MKKTILFLVLLSVSSIAYTQLKGKVEGGGQGLFGATVVIESIKKGTTTKEDGTFLIEDIPSGEYEVSFSYIGFRKIIKKITISDENETTLFIELDEDTSLEEIVISANLKPRRKSETVIPVEVYSSSFLEQNPSPSIFESLDNINGVRPQINCSVCNTGDIRINGLEGPYTSVLIDGLPIVSSLASVYSLNALPLGMVERLEVIKGPSGTIYGSQAVGGIINIITKLPEYSPTFFVENYTTSWLENNLDIGHTTRLGKNLTLLSGVNVFWYDTPIDNNNDNFTDVALQKRISVFEKLSYKKINQVFANLALRYIYEDRWGGELNWTPEFRGSDQIYGESIFTRRFEVVGNNPFLKNFDLQYSFTSHNQNSQYGDTFYSADEKIGFAQLIKKGKFNNHDWVSGLSVKYTIFDDNTPATENQNSNRPNEDTIIGFFIDDEIKVANNHKLLLGTRLDYHFIHGEIFTPRVGYKLTFKDQSILRFNYAKGFRVVNIFTEDHAALNGSRDLIINSNISPEVSHNSTINFYKNIYTKNDWIMNIDMSGWYTHFENQILPDYETNPNQIIYNNLDGYAVSSGVGVNYTVSKYDFRAQVGFSFMDVYKNENNVRTRPEFTENFTGNWTVTIPIKSINTQIDYTGTIYGPMKLPRVSEYDPRPEYSPVWSIQNIKISYVNKKQHKFFVGVKNLLDWTPANNLPFLIARSNDPFDKNVSFDADGNALKTANNPNALVFDPTYIYAPNQGIRVFAGINVSLF